MDDVHEQETIYGTVTQIVFQNIAVSYTHLTLPTKA